MATNKRDGKLPLPRILFSGTVSPNDFHIVDTHRGVWKKCTSRVTFQELLTRNISTIFSTPD
jgi:hypothetical protein